MTELAQLDAIIDDSLQSARDAQDAATGYTEQAQTAAAGVITSIGTAPDVDEIDIPIPFFTSPDQDLGDEYRTQRDLTLGNIKAELNAKATTYMATYFPNFGTAIEAATNQWLLDTINGGLGLPAAVVNQLWQQGRDREARATSQTAQQAVDQIAAMGWDLGSEYVNDARLQIIVEGRKQSSELNRTITIESARIRVESAKFAIEQAINYRLGVIRSLIDYLQLFLQPDKMATDDASAFVEAKRRLWESASAYYRALIDSKELLLRGQMANQAKDLEIVKYGVEALVAVMKGRVDAAVAAAGILGDIASAARAGINALVHEGHLTNAES